MKKNGYAETTIKATGKRLRHLQENCNLKDPEDVKGYIANKQCSNAYKETLIEAYDILMRSINQKWQKPFYECARAAVELSNNTKLTFINNKQITQKTRCIGQTGFRQNPTPTNLEYTTNTPMNLTHFLQVPSNARADNYGYYV